MKIFKLVNTAVSTNFECDECILCGDECFTRYISIDKFGLLLRDIDVNAAECSGYILYIDKHGNT